MTYITSKSKVLNDYSYFIYKIKEYRKSGYTKEEAVTMAMNDCINQKILETFLKITARRCEKEIKEVNFMTIKQSITQMLDNMSFEKLAKVYYFIQNLSDNSMDLSLGESDFSSFSEDSFAEWNTPEEDEFWKDL